MPIHRKLPIPGGMFTADADWAAANKSPETDDADLIRGLVSPPMKLPRPGTSLMWWVSYYDGDSSSAVKVPAPGASFDGELVFECGSSDLQYKAQDAISMVPIKGAVIEDDMLQGRACWVRLTGVAGIPGGATHIWIGYDIIERTGT